MLTKPPQAGKEREALAEAWPGELVLGIRKGIRYSTFSHGLERGEALLLYTDGASEAVSAPVRGRPARVHAGSYYGEERLAQSLARHMDAPDARNQLEGIRADLLAHMGGEAPHDDITLMVIRRR